MDQQRTNSTHPEMLELRRRIMEGRTRRSRISETELARKRQDPATSVGLEDPLVEAGLGDHFQYRAKRFGVRRVGHLERPSPNSRRINRPQFSEMGVRIVRRKADGDGDWFEG